MESSVSSETTTTNKRDLVYLIALMWREKWLILAITFVFAVTSVVVALSIPNTYTAQAKLAPAADSEGGGLAALAGQFGGLASLAGVNLGGNSKEDKVMIALETLKSRKFSRYFIEKYDILVPLMAVEKWDLATGNLVYNTKLYDPKTQQWVREVEPPYTPEPSFWEAHKSFNSRLNAKQDEMTQLVTISFEHESPELAKQWVDWMIQEVNELIRVADIEESEASIAYLEKKLRETELTTMRQVLYQLIETEQQKAMLANVRDDYVLKPIDPAIVPQEKSGPNRPLICFVITLLGGILALVVVVLKDIIWPRKST
ncbi:LPS O-antigen length regulator [Pseudidiomarina sediminum]|uniref:LPS O-antigen length regulator n=1 Tax=Pseudidiomarina sediminum TaxID=431675 RepID=A0A432Z9K6_9GAMM|nr:LPS O-antigen length regulator [Pseudidiomarina sediminum]